MSTEVLLPPPQVSLLDSRGGVECGPLSALCAPHRGVRRPSGTAESESDTPPSKKSKKAPRRRKKPRQRCGRNRIRNKPVAPFNTTQFLMEEHDQLQDTDIIARPRRHRDSSLSLEFEEEQSNQFYSSPEDESEFLTKEFWMAYEDVHAERLDTMTKAQLVQEYLALEEKVDLLERQLRVVRARHRSRVPQPDEEDEEDDPVGPGEVRVDSETAQKITIFQSEITNLEQENKRLREENFNLRRSSVTRSSSSGSSSSSSSGSSSSSSSSDSSSDSEMEDGEGRKVGGTEVSGRALITPSSPHHTPHRFFPFSPRPSPLHHYTPSNPLNLNSFPLFPHHRTPKPSPSRSRSTPVSPAPHQSAPRIPIIPSYRSTSRSSSPSQASPAPHRTPYRSRPSSPNPSPSPAPHPSSSPAPHPSSSPAPHPSSSPAPHPSSSPAIPHPSASPSSLHPSASPSSSLTPTPLPPTNPPSTATEFDEEVSSTTAA